MSTYQDEIFSYLIKKDNFITTFEIYQLFPEIKNKLIDQFWQMVKESLEELNKETNWKIEISDNIFVKYSNLTIWVDDNFRVAFHNLNGNPHYGLWIDFDNKDLDRSKINSYAEDIKRMNGMVKHDWWLGWAYSGADFSNIETLKKILPDNREDYARELARLLFELSKDLKEDILKMSKMTKR